MTATEKVLAPGSDLGVVASDAEQPAARPLSDAELDGVGGGLIGAALVVAAGYGVASFGRDQGWW